MRSGLIVVTLLVVLPLGYSAAGDLLYVEVDGSNCVWPAPNATFTVSVFLWAPYDCGAEGILDLAIAFERTFAGFKLAQRSFLGGPDFGDVEQDGWLLTTGGECRQLDQYNAIYVAEVDYLYLGTPGYIRFVGHPVHGNTFTNCGEESCSWFPEYYPGEYVGVAMTPPNGCWSVPGVELASWGSIKALYR